MFLKDASCLKKYSNTTSFVDFGRSLGGVSLVRLGERAIGGGESVEVVGSMEAGRRSDEDRVYSCLSGYGRQYGRENARTSTALRERAPIRVIDR